MCAFQAQGKTVAELLPTLGINETQWAEVDAHWQDAMAKDETFALATELGQVFQNPAVGKFANLSAKTAVDSLNKVPDLEAYADLQAYISVATEAGVDPQEALKNRGLDVSDFSQIGQHYFAEMQSSDDVTNTEVTMWFGQRVQDATRKYKAEFGLPLDDED